MNIGCFHESLFWDVRNIAVVMPDSFAPAVCVCVCFKVSECVWASHILRVTSVYSVYAVLLSAGCGFLNPGKQQTVRLTLMKGQNSPGKLLRKILNEQKLI